MQWILGILFLSSVAFVADGQDYAYYMNKAERLKNNNRYQEAIALVDSALIINDKQSQPFAIRAYCYYAIGKNAQAIADCNQAIRRAPNQDYLYLLKAYSYAKFNQYEELRDVVFHADSIYKDGFTQRLQDRFRMTVENDEVAMYDYQAAVASLDTAIQIRRDCMPCRHLRSRLNKALGKYDLAMKDMNTSIAMEPENTTLYLERALLHEARGEYTDAYWDLTTAIEIDPDLADAYLNRGVLLYEQLNNPKSGCRDLQQAKRLGAKVPEYVNDCSNP